MMGVSSQTARFPGEWITLLRSSIRYEDDPAKLEKEQSLLRRMQQLERDLVAVGLGSQDKRVRAKSKRLGLMAEAERWWQTGKVSAGNPNGPESHRLAAYDAGYALGQYSPTRSTIQVCTVFSDWFVGQDAGEGRRAELYARYLAGYTEGRRKGNWREGAQAAIENPASFQTAAQASGAAYRAGRAAGYANHFQEWLRRTGLDARSPQLQSLLREQFSAGAIASRRETPVVEVYRGVPIRKTAGGYSTGIDPESLFDSAKDAKRFVDVSTRRRNPQLEDSSLDPALEELALAVPTIRKMESEGLLDDSGARTMELVIRRMGLSEREAYVVAREAAKVTGKASGRDVAVAWEKMVPDKVAVARRNKIWEQRVDRLGRREVS